VDNAPEASFIKTEPREQDQQRAPMRSYQDPAQYAKYVEEEHEQEQLYDDDNGPDVEQGIVALDDGYAVDTAGYEDQYEDQNYQAEGQNIDYNHGQEVTQGKIY
jgi:hypothetical protein